MGVTRRWRSSMWPLAVFGVVACGDGSESPTQADRIDIRKMVVPELAARLAPDGRWLNVVARERGAHGIISPYRASMLALAYAQQWGRLMRHHVEKIHGEPVDFGKLTADPDVILAESPHTDLAPGATIPEQRLFGDYYLVTVRSARELLMTVAVSAHANDFTIDQNGLVSHAAMGTRGNDFRAWIISRGGNGEPRIDGYEAIRRAYTTFGRRVAAQPQFVQMGADYVAQLGNWKLRLESPVTAKVVGTGKSVAFSEVYLDRHGAFGVPADTQRSVRYRADRNLDAMGRGSPTWTPLRRGMANVLTQVNPQPEN